MGRRRRQPRSQRDRVGNRRSGRPLRQSAACRREHAEAPWRIRSMSDDDSKLALPDLEGGALPLGEGTSLDSSDTEIINRGAADLEAVFDVPVKVSAVLGRARMEVGELLKLGPGAVLELDRKVGEAIDIYVNDRLVARVEVVLVEDKLGVTMTEIIKQERT